MGNSFKSDIIITVSLPSPPLVESQFGQRKVRTTQGITPANGRGVEEKSSTYGQCHRKQTAIDLVEGKGENVR